MPDSALVGVGKMTGHGSLTLPRFWVTTLQANSAFMNQNRVGCQLERTMSPGAQFASVLCFISPAGAPPAFPPAPVPAP
jgi:hypothetical protein